MKRLLFLGVLLSALVVGFPAASVGASAGPPSSVSYNPEPLGSWAAVGDTLDADPGVWTGNPTSITAQWLRCDRSGNQCAAIAGGTELSLTLDSSELGATVYAIVTASNPYGERSVTTYLSGVVGAPTVTSEPVISGNVNVDGSTLTVSQGGWTGTPTAYAYQWSRCSSDTLVCTKIPGATSSSYQVDDTALLWDYLSVEVTASDASGSALNVARPSFAIGTAHTDVVGPELGRPAAVVNPSFSGDESQPGNVLVADPGVWEFQPTNFYYEWLDCDSGLGNCRQIAGAHSFTYVVQRSDGGATIGFAVIAENAYGVAPTVVGGGSLINNTYISIEGASGAPEPILPPRLTGDADGVGSVIRVTPVTWSVGRDPTVMVDYRWVRCSSQHADCVTIPGALSSAYTLTSADLGETLYAIVDIANSYGTTALSSTTYTGVIGAPVNADPPVITGDTGTTGATLTVARGTWEHDPSSFTYVWYRCNPNGGNCVPISGATTSTYVTTGSDVGGTLIANVSAGNTYGRTAASSAMSDVIGSPYDTRAPTLSSSDSLSDGTPIAELGDTLTISPGSWSGNPTGFVYQWYRCDTLTPTTSDFTNCNAISGAGSANYTTTHADLGHTIDGEISATNATGTTSVDLHTLGSVGVPQPLHDEVSFSGTAEVGSTLTLLNLSSWAGDTPITWRYAWSRCDSAGDNCASIEGATADSYTLTADDLGHTVRGVVKGSNTWGGNGWGLVDTSPVISAAGSGGTGGGGGGGGGGSSGIPPDLTVTVSANTSNTPAVGTGLIFFVKVFSKNSGGSSDAHLQLTLPGGYAYDHLYIDRGSCSGTAPTITCDVAFINPSASTNITIFGSVAVAGELDVSASVQSQQEPDLDLSNNATTFKLLPLPAPAGGSTPTPSPPAAPPKTLVVPLLVGKHVVGSVLRATPPKWSKPPPTRVAYHWQLCKATRCTSIPGATHLSLTLRASFAGHTVRLIAIATSGFATTTTVSKAVAVTRH